MDQASRIEYHIANDRHKAFLPLVDIVIANTRGADNPWFLQAMHTAKNSAYGNTGVLVVNNNDRSLSIGAAWNLAVRKSVAELVLFLGDDDYISSDLVGHLSGTFDKLKEREDMAQLVLVTSCCSFVDADGKTLDEVKPATHGLSVLSRLQLHHTGMFDRAFLRANPFAEDLAKEVGSNMHREIVMSGRKYGCIMHVATGYHYGYFYRQHIGMVSGMKVYRPNGMAIV
jgi:glycosyltransferase involved in cell wall biosynthesis